MKRGIEVWPDYDRAGDPMLHVQKQRGKLSLEEIRQAAMEYDEDVYALIINAVQTEDQDWDANEPTGDHVVLYRAEGFFRRKRDNE